MYWCFHCYGLNPEPSGPCRHCGREVAAPDGISFDQRLIWTLGHPDSDRAVLAARTLGARGVRAAAPRLAEIAVDAEDPFLSVEALRSLLQLEDPEALRPLLTELARSGPFVAAEIAREALQRSGTPNRSLAE